MKEIKIEECMNCNSSKTVPAERMEERPELEGNNVWYCFDCGQYFKVRSIE